MQNKLHRKSSTEWSIWYAVVNSVLERVVIFIIKTQVILPQVRHFVGTSEI